MPEAVAAFEKALELEPDNAYARKALGFMQVKGAWADARRVLTERLAVLSANDHGKRVELADFCREHSLFPEEHKLLVEVLAADARHRGAIRRIERILARRSPRTPLSPPFEGRWIGWVDTSRHHKAKVFALFAIDFLRVDQRNEPFAGRRARSTADYHGFGAKIYAAAPGKVIQAEGGHPDMRLGRMGGFDKANSVTIRHASGECTTYGHLKQGSVKVKVGQAVRRGQLLGQVGNSGRSGTPHLHFAMMVPAYDSKGRGVYLSVPYRFASFELVRAGRAGCQIQVKSARPQEGWVIVCPKPESEAQQSK